MSAHDIADWSEILQGFLIPLLAFALAWQAFLMRLLARQILAAHIQINAIIAILGQMSGETESEPSALH